jgi:phage FluMu protein Com
MIGTIKKQTASQSIRNAECPECKASDSLYAVVYSKIFILRILPFASGKQSEVRCANCKKVYETVWGLPAHIADQAYILQHKVRHPWYAYIGYVLMAAIIIGAMISKINRHQ